MSRDAASRWVLRDSTSISPDLQRGEAILGRQRHELDLGRIVEDGRRDRPADVDVEAGPVTRCRPRVEKPGRPWLTPQDSMPRSLTVLRVCAEAAWAERPAAGARVATRDTRFARLPAGAFRGRPGDRFLGGNA